MRRLWAATAFAFFSLCVCAQTQPAASCQSLPSAKPEDAGALADAGAAFLRNQRFEDAADCYRKLLAIAGNSSEAQLNLGAAEFGGGRFPDAIDTLRSVLAREPDNAQARKLLALSYFGGHMYADAAKALQLALASDPQNSELRLYLAQSLLWSAQLAPALETLQQLRRDGPDSAIVRVLTAEALHRLDHAEQAIAELRAVLEKFPSEPNIHFGIGYIYWTQHKDDEAEQELKLEVVQDPANAHAWTLLGDIEIRGDRPAQARPLLEKALAIDPSIHIERLDLGIVYAEDKQYDRAIAEFKEAIRLDDARPDAHLQLARVYQQTGKAADAEAEMAILRKLREQERQNVLKGAARTLVNRGDELARDGKNEEAMTSYQKARETDPECAEAYSRIGALLVQSGKLDEAIAPLEKAVALNPDDALARDDLAGALALSNGRTAEAIAFCENALQRSPEDVALHVNLAIALNRAGKLDESIGHLQKAAQLRPDDATVQGNLGAALLGKGSADEAIPHLEKALELAPASAEAHYKVGELCYSRGKPAQALVHWRKALTIDPNYAPALLGTVRILATSPDASLRNGAEAAALSERLLRVADGKDPAVLAVVAAADAEAGRFPEAVQSAKRALELATARGDQTLVAELNGSIRLYQAGRPLRDRQ
ncbi:MAG: tetratricopeptide repeat protein [Bryobacteraceae bacterium]